MTDGLVRRTARAKINLCLHVTGQRPDGYHMLDSLVVFARLGDVITAERSARNSLSISGAQGVGLSADGDNLVLRAAGLMPGCPAALHLEKVLPVASGIGGGSADAAATLHALAELWGRPLPRPEAVLALGADVPVCLAGRPCRMRGIGDLLEPLPSLPPVWVVLVNPGVSCPTGPVFAGLASKHNPPIAMLPGRFEDAAGLVDVLSGTRNDLEAPALARVPVIGEAIAALRAQPGCGLARMSGSGATVFGIFESEAQALAAADAIRARASRWWVAAAPVDP